MKTSYYNFTTAPAAYPEGSTPSHERSSLVGQEMKQPDNSDKIQTISKIIDPILKMINKRDIHPDGTIDIMAYINVINTILQ